MGKTTLLSVFLSLVAAAAVPNRPVYVTSVGDFTLTVINDGIVSGNPAESVVNVPAPAVAKAMSAHFVSIPNSRYFNPVHLDTGARKVVFDTGSGPKSGPKVGKLLRNMRAAHVDPDAVDSVVISHAHVDHVGGLLKRDGSLAFPNASYYLSRVEYEFWTNAKLTQGALDYMKVPERRKRRILNIAKKALKVMKDRLTLFEFGEEILPGVTSKALVGHTPGHSGFIIRSAGDMHLLAGDAFLNDFMAVENPEWEFAFDANTSQAIQTRFDVLEEMAKGRIRTSFYHSGFPGIGHIYNTGKGYAFRPARYELLD